MARYRLCKYCGAMHRLGRWPDNCKDDPWPRSDHPAPYVISDYLPGGINGLYHHAACTKIDSKSAYRRATRDHGCIEVGNELVAATTPRSHESNDHEIESAINDALNECGMDDGKGDDAITITSEQNIGKGIWQNGP